MKSTELAEQVLRGKARRGQCVSVAAVVIQHEERRLLIGKRKDGRYGLPAGSVELGEDPVMALRREVREETGCELGLLSENPISVYSTVTDDGWHSITLYYLVDLIGEAKTMPDESIGNWQWVTHSELERLSTFGNTKTLANTYIK